MLSFVTILEQNVQATEGKKKRERTHDRFLLATAQCLEAAGFNALRASDISEKAGLAEGTFYLYFSDKKEAAIGVLQGFLSASVAISRPLGSGFDAFSSIRSANYRWLESAKSNPGLVRALFQLTDQDPHFADYYAEQNFRWHSKVAKSVFERYPSGSANPETITFAIRALGSMMDEITRQLYGTDTPSKVWRDVEPCKQIDDLADTLSIMWFRVLYPGAKLDTKLRKFARKFETLDGSSADLS